ncbi:nitroreductase family protein [Corynebacterium caspium]|uniref:nitroreductase family protein n=1 Tax=Corynebacterium caspium TaxID=234828 RepID=UPI00037B2477|nr:nitroreductase family protein [Corynebacterium caspium]WKD59538.1 Nitroreductase family protein [Corynebacterium caspium DSM 44850]
MTPAEFSELAASRHSVRSFHPDPIPEETLQAIFADARTAPSWSNTRPYMLAIATGERADRLRAAYVRKFTDVLPLLRGEAGAAEKLAAEGKLPDGDFKTWVEYPAELKKRREELGAAMYQQLGIAREDAAARDAHSVNNFRAFDAPVMGFVFVHQDLLPFSAQDGGLMLQTLFLSAKAHGVDSCALGVLATWRSPLAAEFDIPAGYVLVSGFALGYGTAAAINDFRAERPELRFIAPKK